MTKDVGHWQGKSRVVGGRTENYLQRISSEVRKTDHQVGWVGRESLLQILSRWRRRIKSCWRRWIERRLTAT